MRWGPRAKERIILIVMVEFNFENWLLDDMRLFPIGVWKFYEISFIRVHFFCIRKSQIFALGTLYNGAIFKGIKKCLEKSPIIDLKCRYLWDINYKTFEHSKIFYGNNYWNTTHYLIINVKMGNWLIRTSNPKKAIWILVHFAKS